MNLYALQRLTATDALILQYEGVMAALAIGKIQSYSLDTGQDRQTVTKLDLSALKNYLNVLYNQRDAWAARARDPRGNLITPVW